MKNLGEFLKKYSQKHGDRIAYQIKRGLRTQRFTFNQVYQLSLKTAAFLSSKGIKKGDKVAIWAPNMPEYSILYFGLWVIGAVAVPIDIRTTQETLKVFLTKARCKIGFKSKFIPGSFGNLVKESFYLEDLVEQVNVFPPLGWKREYTPGVSSEDLAEIAFTSGTTGTPKGVMLTHGNFLSNVDALTKAFPFEKNWRALSLLPLSHAFEQVVDFLALFKEGIQVTYLERINRLTILNTIRKNKITSAALVPQALNLLMNGIEQQVEKQGKQKIWQLLNLISQTAPMWARRLLFRQVHQKLGGKLKFFGCGSAPLNVKLAQKWENLGIEVFEGYGATETTAVLTLNTPFAKKLGSVGKVLPGMGVAIDTKVSTQHTSKVKYIDTPEMVGEIVANGPNISPGYFENEEKTRAAFFNGRYRTGDIGKIDKDGFLYITGREAFRIVLPNGQKVYPEDIEKKLDAHPLVVASCVAGVKREEGETVHAAIITKFPSKLETIILDVNQKLASHEQILSFSHWREEDFPRTPILKIDRRKVAQAILSERSESKDLEARPRRSRAYDLRGQLDPLTHIISQISKRPLSKIKEQSTLATDLGIDSLGRVELLSRIEEEFAVAIPEIKISQKTTIGQVRALIKQSPTEEEEIPVNNFLYNPLIMKARVMLQNFVVHPLHAAFVPINIKGRENLEKLTYPVIFYFNHIGIMDGLCVLRVLPGKLREKLVIAVNEELWHDYRRAWIEIFGSAFPFDKKEKVKASLELTNEFLDRGFSLLMAPEGTFTKTGKLLDFKIGIGLLAVETQVPVVPVKIDPAYLEIFPPMDGKFIENLPKKRKRITISIGHRLTFSKNTPYEEATKKMRDAIENL